MKRPFLGNLSQAIVNTPRQFIHERMNMKDILENNKQVDTFSLPKKSKSINYYRQSNFLNNQQFCNMNLSHNYRYQRPNKQFFLGKQAPVDFPENEFLTTKSLDSKISIPQMDYKTWKTRQKFVLTDISHTTGEEFRSNMKNKTNFLIEGIKDKRKPRLNRKAKTSPCETDVFCPTIFKSDMRVKTFEEEFNEVLDKKLTALSSVSPKIKGQIKYRHPSYQGKNKYFDIVHYKPDLKEMCDNADLRYRRYNTIHETALDSEA